MFYVQNILIYVNFGGYVLQGDVHGPKYIFCLLKKNRKSTRSWPILKSNSTSFWFKKEILGWVIKILQKGAPAPISLGSEYGSSN